MKCPRCGSNNIQVQMVQSQMKTNRKGIGAGGHTNNAARTATAIMTCGISNIFWKKSEGVNKTKVKNAKQAICQDCGKSWNVR